MNQINTPVSESPKQKILKSLYSLPKTSERQGWKLYYDTELDNLYISPKRIPRDAVLENLNEEIALYITPNFEIAGIFIEYFSENFVKHKKEYKKVLRMFPKRKGVLKIIAEKKKEAGVYQEALINQILKNAPALG